MTDRRRIAALARVAGICKDADLAMLAAAGLRLRSLQARVEALDTAITEARATAATAADPPALAALEAFSRWSQRRRLELAESLDDAERQVAEARSRARVSFGRADVLTRLSPGPSTVRLPDT